MVVTQNSAQVEKEPIIAAPPQGMPNTRGKRRKIVASKKKRYVLFNKSENQDKMLLF